ncbi:hypothetical protein N7527_009612 [Penicillium freii]|nr:hypothetical protein N7527_009612 [Penicillium freii]
MAQLPIRSLKAGVNNFQGPIVTITVGPSKEHFYVHKSLICTSSLFFNRAMSGSWKGSEVQTLNLPEDDPNIFALYSHWLYVGQIPVIVQSGTKEEIANDNFKEYYTLVKAYVLGDKLLDDKFRNSTIQAIIEKATTPCANGQRHYPGADVIIYATECAKIRNLLVDIYVEVGEPGWLTKELSHDFLYSVVEGLMRKRAERVPEL